MTFKISDAKFGFLLSFPALILVFLLIIYPLFHLLHISFLRYDNYNPVIFWGLNNFRFIFVDDVFWKSLENTFVYCTAVTGLTLFTGLIMAHSLNRLIRGSTFFRTLFILPWALPLVISGLIFQWIFDPTYGPLNYVTRALGLGSYNVLVDPATAKIAVILCDCWTRIPFMTVIILAGLQSISEDLYSAAKVDGADSLSIFRYISLPLNKRAMLFGVFIVLLFSSRTVDIIYALTGGGPAKATYTMGNYLWENLFLNLDFGVTAAISVVMLGYCMVLVFIFGYFIFRRE